MLITCTPFRVSFFGGGTDLPSFYKREAGRVLSTTIAAHMYITVHQLSPFYPFNIRLSYSRTEQVKEINEVKHPVIRECLKMLKIDKPIEITSIADIPAKTGLGSSSSFTVGLLHSLHAFKGEYVSPDQLAEEACHVEIDLLREPIGRQDQYAAAFGGLRTYTFREDNTVSVRPVICKGETISCLFDNLMMFYVGGTRKAKDILREQSRKTTDNIENLRRMREMCEEGEEILRVGPENILAFGHLLHAAWQLKRSLASKISNPKIDECYERALKAGAIGGKLLGAGGTGFLLLFVEKNKQPQVRKTLGNLIEQPLSFDPEGSRLIYVGKSWYK